MQRAAIGLLSRSYFNAFRGMPWLLGIGLALIALGWLAQEPSRTAFLFAGALFATLFPAFFAGVQFRKLASRRTFLLLPGFSGHMVVSVFVVVALVSVLGGTAVAWAIDRDVIICLPLAMMFLSAVFWIGFLPWPLRFLISCGIVLAASEDAVRHQALTADVATLALISCFVGWSCFSVWFARVVAARRVFMPATVGWRRVGWMPRRVGSAEGTLLRGSPDALPRSAVLALGRVVVLPSLFCWGFWLLAGVSPERLFRGPVIGFLSLSYAFVSFLQLATRVGSRRMLLWLRIETDRKGLARRCEAVLWRELATIGGALALLLPVLSLLPALQLAPWIWFVVAWFTGLVAELYLALDRGPSESQRFWLASAHLLVLAAAAGLVQIGFDARLLIVLAVGHLLAALVLRSRALDEG